MPIIGLNRIFDDRQAALESFGELGEREISRYDDGKQVLARYYDEDGNIASLIGIYHYKRTEGGVDYGNIEVKDYSLFDIEQYITIMVENIHEIENIIQQNTTNIQLLTARLRICCAESPEDDTNYSALPLTVEALTDGDFRFETYNNCTVKYRTTSNPVWETIGPGEDATISLQQGEKALFRGDNLGRGQVGQFHMDNDDAYHFEVYGNVMSLLYDWDFIGQTNLDSDNVFQSLFADCYGLISAENLILPATEVTAHGYDTMFAWCYNLIAVPQLPATAVSEYGYYEMFYDCDSLVNAPEIPATELFGDYCYQEMFCECDNLVNGPSVLPATYVPEGGYSNMFNNCPNLTSVPEISATDLSANCCESMFANCISLVSAQSILPATELSEYCYSCMFESCENLLNVPELPATGLAEGCYSSMFWGCSSLTVLPELPATELQTDCYNGMFGYCTSLQVVDEDYLMATELAEYCYSYMFTSCSNLRQAPVLRAEYLQNHCYESMFNDCSSLTSITCYAMDVDCTTHTKRWLRGVAYPGTFRMPARSAAPWELDSEDGVPVNWRVKMFDYDKAYLTFRGIPGSSGTIQYRNDNDCSLEYSVGTDYDNWEDANNYDFELLPGTVVRIRGNNLGNGRIGHFDESEDPRYEVYGNAMSLIYGDDFVDELELGADNVFNEMFADNERIISCEHLVLPATAMTEAAYYRMFANCYHLQYGVDNLPATELAYQCYFEMFNTCEDLISTVKILPAEVLADECYMAMYAYTDITASPILPATILAESCYSNMFVECKYLKTAPELPATVLTEWCYQSMFARCYSLIVAPELPATELARACYTSMFAECKNLVTPPELPAETLADECYSEMFLDCINLVTPPELPATGLSYACYNAMFNGCKSLKKAPELPSTELAEVCYNSMFGDCASLEEAPELPAMQMAEGCYSSMFFSCVSLKTPPVLPSTELAEYCYNAMFSQCINLETVPELPATTLSRSCYTGMFEDCKKITTSPELPATELAAYCYHNMFNGCSSLRHIRCFATNISANDCLRDWVYGVSPSGEFEKNEDMNNWPLNSANGIPAGWSVSDGIYYKETYFTVKGLGDGDITWSAGEDCTMTYSTDNGGTWNTISPGDSESITILDGGTVMFRNTSYSGGEVGHLTSDVDFEVYGNIMSLLQGNNFIGEYNISQHPDVFVALLSGNEHLIHAKDLILPATALSVSCYSYMFEGCENLEDAPMLPAMELANNCYYGMFASCTSLEKAPRLPARILAAYCYAHMFQACGFSEAPELPATVLVAHCYDGMFAYNESLYKAPKLPAETLVQYCYNNMFLDCSHLEYIECMATGVPASNCTFNWLNGVSSEGQFVKNEANNTWSTGVSGIPSGWVSYDTTYKNQYLTIKVLEPGDMRWNDYNDVGGGVEYSTDNGDTWTTFGWTTFQSGTTILVRGYTAEEEYVGKFDIRNGIQFSVYGNIMSLLYGEDFRGQTDLGGNFVFPDLFSGCEGIIIARNLILPATDVGESSYEHLFGFCTNLLTPPEVLPAEFVGYAGYRRMFEGCENLLIAPEILADAISEESFEGMFTGCENLLHSPEVLYSSVLAPSCYYYMFENCKNLIDAPELKGEKLADSCYNSMFWGCENLRYAPELPVTEFLDINNNECNSCYEAMFSNCKLLRNAPELPATMLAPNCYNSMFEECYNLEMPPVLPAANLKEYCYANMFSACHYLERVTRLPVLQLSDGCYYNMFAYTQITHAPDLYAETLVSYCYAYMFNNCSRLKYIKCRASNISANGCLNEWVTGVASNGRFVRRNGTNIWPTGTNGIPNGWTVEQSYN